MNNKKNKFKTFIERNKKSNGYLLRKVSFNVFYKIIRAVLLFGLCFMILQPLLNKVSLSFMEEQDLYDSTIVAIPRHFTLDNYKIAAYLMKVSSEYRLDFIDGQCSSDHFLRIGRIWVCQI